MKIIPALCLAVCLLPKAQADIIFDGDWANYFDTYYDANRWQNGAQLGQPTPAQNWSEIMAFWSPKPLPNTWLFNSSSAPDRIQLVDDIHSPKGGKVARFEVRSGDHMPVHSGERSEMYAMLDAKGKKLPVTEANGREFYGISVKVDADWKAPQPEPAEKGYAKWGTFMQLHSPNVYNSPPSVALAAQDEFALHMNAGELVRFVPNSGTGLLRKRNKDSDYIKLANGDLRRGRWVQFIMEVKWSAGITGDLTLYRRDEGEKDFNMVLQLAGIPTLQTSQYIPTDLASCPACATDNIVHYWRVGYYRSTSPGQTNVLWLGPVVRGTDFDEVARGAFGSTGLKKAAALADTK